MRFAKIFLYISFMPVLLFAQNKKGKVYTHAEVGAIIQKVSQGNKSSLDELMKISLGDHPITLTQDIVKVVTFGLIRSNQTTKLDAYLKKIDPGLIGFLDDKKINQDCKHCEGKGFTKAKCPKCKFGKCYNCKGTGYIEYKGLKGASKSADGDTTQKVKSICNVCVGTGKCTLCEGEGEIKKPCPYSRSGQVLNKNALLKEMLSSIQNISKQTESYVETKIASEVKANNELDSLFNQTVKKSVESKSGNEQINPMEESGIQKAFKKSKEYIEAYELKNNKDICEDISLKYLGEVPAMVLDLSDTYMQKIDSSKVREVSGFKKYWEDQAIIHGYDKEVSTILMHNGLKVNDRFTLSEKYKRVK